MAGLLAANMLRRHDVSVLEKSPTLPRNHTAVLRFRTTAASDATGIPFAREQVLKGLYKDGRVVTEATLEDLNRYSAMVTGGNIFTRSILNLQPAERWCAPIDFVTQMARNLNIEFNQSFELDLTSFGVIISTIPMPFMMEMVEWKDRPKFTFLPVWTIKATLTHPTIRACQTLYRCHTTQWYRATLHNQEVTLEFMFDPTNHHGVLHSGQWIHSALMCFGLERVVVKEEPTLSKIDIGKILPIDESVRKRFMLWMTEKHGVYSLGRFATWRNILLDDVVGDVKKIEAMIQKGHTYDER